MLTVVDSDQAMLRKGYVEHVSRSLGGTPFGVLSSDARPQRADTRIPPAHTAQAERALCQPLLDRFEQGAEAFVHWSFWPATVIGTQAGRAMAQLFADPQVVDIMARSRLWATEEVLFPTFAALLGFPVVQNPYVGHWTQYRRNWSAAELERAANNPGSFWMHPVPRNLDHPLRQQLRRRSENNRWAPPAPGPRCRAGGDHGNHARHPRLAGG